MIFLSLQIAIHIHLFPILNSNFLRFTIFFLLVFFHEATILI